VAGDELAFLPAVEQAELVRRRQVSPVELVDLYLERIERLDPRLNAYVTACYEEARASAQSAEATPSDRPFHGVPLSIKDMTDTAGVRTTYSSRRSRATSPTATSPSSGASARPASSCSERRTCASSGR
jgi:Asp-tRNA(Asn)/Glu-tRNA(Gln) amidotransferase A subunit family amidase